MLADLHTHTNTSHGHHSAAEMYEAAAAAGLDLFGLSEHSPLPEEYACKLYVAAFPGNFRDFVQDVQALRQRELEREDRPLPLLGVELDWLPDYPRHMCRFLALCGALPGGASQHLDRRPGGRLCPLPGIL